MTRSSKGSLGRSAAPARTSAGPAASRAPDTLPARRRILVIHNPVAGIARRRLLARVLSRLGEAGAIVTLVTTPDAETGIAVAETAAASGDADIVVAAGGDSTVRGAAVGIARSGRPVPLAVIPVGTGNVLASEIGIGRRSRAIASTILEGPVVAVEGLSVAGEACLLIAGAGFDGAVLAGLDQSLKRRIGKLAYVWPGLRSLLRPAPTFVIETAGERTHCRWLIIANGSRYGGPFVVAPGHRLGSGTIMAIALEPGSRWRLLTFLVDLVLGRLERRGDVRIIETRHIAFEAGPGIAVQIDGELLPRPRPASQPVVVETAGPRFLVAVPPRYFEETWGASASRHRLRA